MASVKDALDDIIADDLSLVKFFLFAVPIYYSLYLYTVAGDNYTFFWFISSLTFLLLLGFLIITTTNVMNGKDYVLPGYNIFKILWAALKGFLAVGPSFAINTYLAIFVTSKISLSVPWVDITLKIIIWGIFVSIALTSFVLYTKRQKISDAYNFKIISESCIDILIAILFFVPRLLILNAIIVGSISYLIWVFLGLASPILTFFWCMAIVFNLGIIGDYLAQIEYENIRGDD